MAGGAVCITVFSFFKVSSNIEPSFLKCSSVLSSVEIVKGISHLSENYSSHNKGVRNLQRDRRNSTERYFSGKTKPECQPNHYSVAGAGLKGDPRRSSRRALCDMRAPVIPSEDNEYSKPPSGGGAGITVEQATLKRDTLLRHSSSGRNSSPAALLLKGHKNWRDEEI